MSDPDRELQLLLGAQNAAAEQMLAGSAELVDLLVTMRKGLVAGGFASDEAHDYVFAYFNSLLDRANPSDDFSLE